MSGEVAMWAGHRFLVYKMDGTSWHDFPGVYIFAARGHSLWVPLYVGQTASFSMLASHGAWPEARQSGATHVHARTVYNPDARTMLERQLIRDYSPRLNAAAAASSLRAHAG